MENTNGSGHNEFVKFELNLAARQNHFTLYLGTIITALFLIIAVVSFSRRRKHTVVNMLAKPDSDAHVYEYILMLKTSIRIGSGLTAGAKVAVQLLGTYSDSRRYTLTQQLMAQNILQRSHHDIFVLYTPMDLGNVRTVRVSLFNFSKNKFAVWRPCFIEVLKSTTRERWGVNIRNKLSAEHITIKSYHLVKGFRDEESLWKLIMKHHQFTSPFFNPQRFGAYTTLTGIIFFFFTQSVLLMTSMTSFILSYQYLGRLSHAKFADHFVHDILPVTIICSLVVSVAIQQIEGFLKSIRPSPSRWHLKSWRGLWRNDYPANLMHSDVTYNWDRPPSHFRKWANKFGSETSLSAVGSSSETSDSSQMYSESTEESSEEEEVDGKIGRKGAAEKKAEEKSHHAAPPKASKDSALKMLRYCMKAAKRSYTDQCPVAEPKEHPSMTAPIMLTTGGILFTGQKTVIGTTVTKLDTPIPGVYCRFCLWVKHLTIRGDDLYSYILNLIHQIRRAIQALRIGKDPSMVIKVMTLCIHQWTSSMCIRMLKEVILKLDKEQMDIGGLQNLHDSLLHCESNLWFTEVGYKEGPYAGKRKGDNSRRVSHLYFTIMRHLVNSYRNQIKGVRGILRRPNEELCPPELKKKKIHFESKVHKKSIMKISDIMDMMSQDKLATAKAEASSPANSTDKADKNQSAINTTRRARSGKTQAPSQSAGDRLPHSAHTSASAKRGDSRGGSVTQVKQSAKKKSSILRRCDFPMGDCGHLSTLAFSQIRALQAGDFMEVRIRESHGSGEKKDRSAFSPSSSCDSDAQSRLSKESWIFTHAAAGQALSTVCRENVQQKEGVMPSASALSDQCELTTHSAGPQRDDNMLSPEDVCLEELRSVSEQTVSSSCNPFLRGESDWCNSHGSSTAQDMIRRMSVQVKNVFKKKIRRYKEAQPQAIFKLLAAFESYANVVQLEVQGPFGAGSCFCCAKPLCQTYAVVYSQLKEPSYRILHHLVAHCITTRHRTDQEAITLTRYYKKIMLSITNYILRRAGLLEAHGHTQNANAIKRLEKELKGAAEKKEQDASSSYSYGSLDSLNLSHNKPAQPQEGGRHRHKHAPHHKGFKFGRRKSHHGLVIRWSHAPYPFLPTVLPPVKLHWGENDSSHSFTKVHSAPTGITSRGDDEPESSAVDVVPAELAAKSSNVSKLGNEEEGSSGAQAPSHKQLHRMVRKMFRKAVQEVTQESRWMLGLRESLASVVAFARIDVAKELQDPMKIAIRNFTHALLVMLFESLLPEETEENFEVTPDDIRQRRKRVSSKRTPGMFDLTENNDPGYDLNFLDFVVVKLCEKWELAKVDLQHQPTLHFLTRCLTMAHLDTDLMQNLDSVIHSDGIDSLILDRMTHVHETQHSLAVVVNEVMAMTLVYVVPETLKAMKDVTGWLRNEDDRATYVCEKVSVMENQVRHKLSRHVLKAAAKDVQDMLLLLDTRQEKIQRREDRMINRLRELVKIDYYYTSINEDELKPIKKGLRQARYMAKTIHSVHTFQQARAVRKYAQKTAKLQNIKVREALVSLTEDRSQDMEYTPRQLEEVEWVMTGQVDKLFPAVCMEFALWLMFLVTATNMILVTILGASFTPKLVAQWFGNHAIAVLLLIVVAEPLKCIWLLDFGWTQPES